MAEDEKFNYCVAIINLAKLLTLAGYGGIVFVEKKEKEGN